MDYVGPEVEDDEIRKTLRLKRTSIFSSKWLQHVVRAFSHQSITIQESEREKTRITPPSQGDIQFTSADDPGPPQPSPQRYTTGQGKHVSFYPDDMTTAATEIDMSPISSPEVGTFRVTSSVATVPQVEMLSSTKDEILPKTFTPKSRSRAIKHRLRRVANTTFTFLRSLITPASLSIIFSLIISLVPTLKALFVPGVPGTHIPPAPDGLPPLSLLIDTASFIGAASVPLGLICLGAALARLKVPIGQWSKLPLGAIAGLAVGKILIMPILGVLICQGLTNVGVIDKEDKVLRFVCM